MIQLTHKRETFARLYVEQGDASKAYREAFPSSQKWKNSSVWESASKLLNDTKVSSRIAELKGKRAQKLDISENRVLAEIAAIAFSDVGELVADGGGFVGIKQLKPAARRAIRSVKYKKFMEDGRAGEIISIEFHPKLQALEKICEIKGITAPPVQQRSAEVNINITGNADVYRAD